MKKRTVSLLLSAVMAASTFMQIPAVVSADKISIYQDKGDYTYFNSNYYNTTGTSTYSLTTVNDDAGTVSFGAADYTNPDKVNDITLTKTSAGDCGIVIDTSTRQADFGGKKKYNYFGVGAEFEVADQNTSLELLKLNGKTIATVSGGKIIFEGGSEMALYQTANTYYANINLAADTVLLYVNGSQTATVSFADETLDSVGVSIGGSAGSAKLLNLDVTGYEKEINGAIPTKSSVFVDRLKAKELLDNYTTAFHAYSGVAYTEGENGDNYKKALLPKPIYDADADELYVKADDFIETMEVNASFADGILTNNDTGTTMNLQSRLIMSGDTPMIPVRKASQLFGIQTFSDGHGMIIPCENAGTLLAELGNSDHWDDVYNEESVLGSHKGAALEVSDVRMMNWYLLYNRPTADKLQQDFNKNTTANEHPRLLVDDTKISQIKAKMNSDSYYASLVNGIISAADKAIAANVIADYETSYVSFRTNEAAEAFETRVKNLSFAYLITGDSKYADQALLDLEAVSAFPDLNYSHIIDSGMWSSGLALGYDWLYNYMSEEQKKTIADAIIRLEIEPVSRAYYAGLPGNAVPSDPYKGGGIQSSNAFTRWKSNYGAYVNSGMILSALAVTESDPELCFDSIEKALRSYEYVLAGMETGEWLESPRYWRTMQSDIAYTASALMSVLDNDYHLLSAPGMKEQSENLIHYTSLNSRFSYGDDSNSYYTIFSQEPFSFYANYYDLPHVAAMRTIKLTDSLRSKYSGKINSKDPGILDVVYYTPVESVEEAMKAIPRVAVKKGSESFIVHQDFLDPEAFFFASAGGPTSFYHSHYDSGDFLFDLGGENWAVTLDSGAYNVPTDERYESSTAGHNTLMIGGVNQKKGTFAPVIDYKESDEGAYAVYDMTELYDGAQSIQRGFYIDDYYTAVTVRDEIKLDAATEGYWFMHTDADVAVKDKTLVELTKDGKKLYMQIDVEGDDSYTVETIPFEMVENNTTITKNKVAIKFNGAQVNITVRMDLAKRQLDTTPIADRTISITDDGTIEVWSQDFDDCDMISDAGLEYIGTNGTATISETGGNKFLDMSFTTDGTAENGEVFEVSTKRVNDMGLKDGDDFIVSYNVKVNPYNAETGYNSTTKKYVEYLLSMGDSPSGVKARQSGYFTFKSTGNPERPDVNTNNQNVEQWTAPNANNNPVKLYPGAWNNLTWVVHRSDADGNELEADKMYTDLYINGEYSTTFGIRTANGSKTMQRAVFAISLGNGITYGRMMIDDIVFYKGAYDKQTQPKAAAVKLIDTGFDDMTASDNVASDVASTPKIVGSTEVAQDAEESVFETKTGALGKSSTDKYLHIYRKDGTQEPDARVAFNTDTVFEKLKKSGESVELSMDFAYDAAIKPLSLTAQLYKEDGSKIKLVDFIKVSGDNIKILNNTFDISPALISDKWYNLRVVFTAGDGENRYNTVTAYIDGKVINDPLTGVRIENYALTNWQSVLGEASEYSRFCGIDWFWLHFKSYKSDAGKGISFDNVRMTKYIGTAKPKNLATMLPILTNSDWSLWAQRGTVYVDATQTIESVLSKFDLSGAKSIVVRDANGSVVDDYTAPASGKFAEIKNSDHRVYYAAFDGTNKTIVNVNDAESTSGMSIESGLTATWINAGAGKTADDTSLKVVRTPGNNDRSVVVNTFGYSTTYSNPTAYKPVTAEVSVMPLGNDKIEVQFYSQAETNNDGKVGDVREYVAGKTPIYFENGTIYGKGVEYPLMSYETGKWYKISITYFPGSAKIEARINGELVQESTEYTVWKYPIQFVRQLKLIVNNEAVFDGIRVYNGKYQPEQAPEMKGIEAEGTKVEGNVITLPDIEYYIDEVADMFEVIGTPTQVYKNVDLTEAVEDGELVENGVLVMENDGIYKEYIIKIGADTPATPSFDMSYADGEYTATASGYPADKTLIIASYNGTVLESVQFGTADGESFVAKITADEGKTVKAFLINFADMTCAQNSIVMVNGQRK